MKLGDNIELQNILFAYDSLNNNLPDGISGKFVLVASSHNLRSVNYHQLHKPFRKTITYGSKSIINKAIDGWNFINREFPDKKVYQKSRPVFKKFILESMLNKY